MNFAYFDALRFIIFSHPFLLKSPGSILGMNCILYVPVCEGPSDCRICCIRLDDNLYCNPIYISLTFCKNPTFK